MLTTEVQVIPIDVILSIISTFINKIKNDSEGADPDDWCKNIELVSMGAYQQLVSSGTIDPRDKGWTVDIGFYEDNTNQVDYIRGLLFDINKMMDKYNYQTNEDTYPVNPMLKAVHDTLLSILQNQRVLTSATITFTIPNLIKHSEGVVDSWRY